MIIVIIIFFFNWNDLLPSYNRTSNLGCVLTRTEISLLLWGETKKKRNSSSLVFFNRLHQLWLRVPGEVIFHVELLSILEVWLVLISLFYHLLCGS